MTAARQRPPSPRPPWKALFDRQKIERLEGDLLAAERAYRRGRGRPARDGGPAASFRSASSGGCEIV